MKQINLLLCLLSTIVAYGQAPVISDFNPKIARPGTTITLTGTGFNTTAVNNVVHFGSILTNVTSATATELLVEVPEGAAAEKITVLNTTTNLLGQTSLNFYPTFDGGARVIPASFLPHQDLATSEKARTVRLVDVDCDGWLDIVSVSRQSIGIPGQEISIFRNLGTGGTLTSNSFAPKIELNVGLADTGGSGMNDFEFTDLDNDGKLDLYFSLDGNSFGFEGAVGIYRNTSTAGTISFEPVRVLNSSQRISYVSAGDFDGDGRQEIVAGRAATAGGTPAYLFIYQNFSSPSNLSFSTEIDITDITPAGTWERMIVMDINGDHKLDLAALRNFEVNTSVLLNQATLGVIDINTFAPSPDLINGSNTVALSDFDGDNLPELITHNEAVNTGIALRPNTSSSTEISFADSIPFFTNIFVEGETAISDMNGDGKKDLVIGTDWSQDWISILENDFTGTWDESSFKQPVRLKTNTGFPSTIDVGDLNHDGRPDIVTANQSAFLSIIENASQFPPQIQNVSSYQAPTGETITITGQHFSTSASENNVRFGSVLANVISASSTELVVEVPLGATYDYITVAVDIYTAISPQKFSVISGAGTAFDANSFALPVAISTAGDVNDLVVGDLDNDGKADLLARDENNLLILRNQSMAGTIEASSFQAIPSTVSLFVQPGQLFDLNGDNYLDLMTQSRVYFNSSQTASEPIEFQDQTTLFTGNSPSFTLTDFNQDGILDNLQTSGSASTVLINEGVYGYAPFGTVNGSDPNLPFLPRQQLPKAANGGTISATDFDGDGLPDIAASNPTTDNVSFFRNLGSADIIQDTNFSTAQNFSVGDSPTQIVAGDLDLDGKTDLAIINQNDNSVSVLHNQSTTGNLSFDTYNYPVSASPRLLCINDLDGDGKPEIVTVNAFVSGIGATFSVLKNNTASMDASSFATEQLYTRSNNAVPANFDIADLDDDDRADIILTSTNPDELIIYKNLVPISTIITISTQPTDDDLCEGETAIFTTSASGTTNITYQWQEDQGSGFTNLSDGGEYSGATTSDLYVANLTAQQDGYQYRCVITGDFAPDRISDIALLQVETLSAISSQPQDQTIDIGDVATFTVTASGENLTYQWQKDGNDLGNETNSTLSISNVAASDQGSYSCTVTSNCNTVISQTANLFVIDPNIGFSVTDLDQNQQIGNAQQTAIDFGIVGVGESIIRSFVIDNTGQTIINVNSIQFSEPNAFAVSNVPTQILPLGGSGSFEIIASSQNPGVFTTSVLIDTDVGSFTFPISVEFSDGPSGGELIVYNAVAPNGNGKHDFLKIENIESFGNNSVQIFNRWGDKVYEATGYDNQTTRFEGTGNVGPEGELVEGTYFYVIKTESEELTGFLFLRR
ncbi:MAG: FG-GAP-like repeat-containing protein [Bacteroidota bacterium]